MTDPLGIAASAATKLGSAVAANYNRGRDERRQVYRRFQEAVVTYVMQIRDSRVSPDAMGLQPDQRKPYIDALMKAMTELAQALNEVRLAGNPGPTEAAEALVQAIVNSFDAAAARREDLTDEEAASYAQAMRAFTVACRQDLLYQPRWWQIWRSGWWRARLRSTKKRQLEPSGEAREGLVAQVNTANGRDVVFGIGEGVAPHGVVHNQVSGIVSGTVVHVTGHILYRGKPVTKDQFD